jgi:hypothetical protein
MAKLLTVFLHMKAFTYSEREREGERGKETGDLAIFAEKRKRKKEKAREREKLT